MSMPRFSAEASLYRASGHYQTGGQALSLPRRTNSLRLALETRGEEIVIVKDCPPGWERLGEGTCVRALPGGGGPAGPPGPGGGGEGSPPGAETPEPPERPERPVPQATKRPRKPKNFHPTKNGECHIRGGGMAEGYYNQDCLDPDCKIKYWECCSKRLGGGICYLCDRPGLEENPCRDRHVDTRPPV